MVNASVHHLVQVEQAPGPHPFSRVSYSNTSQRGGKKVQGSGAIGRIPAVPGPILNTWAFSRMRKALICRNRHPYRSAEAYLAAQVRGMRRGIICQPVCQASMRLALKPPQGPTYPSFSHTRDESAEFQNAKVMGVKYTTHTSCNTSATKHRNTSFASWLSHST